MFKTFSTTLLGLLALTSVWAQSSESIRVKVPFAFAVQNLNLEAGNYSLSYNHTSHLLSIQGLDQNVGKVFIPAIPSVASQSSNGTAKLIFQCYGEACSLAQVWQGPKSGNRGLTIRPNEQQRALAFSSRAVSITLPAR